MHIQELVITIDLPLCKSARPVQLDIEEETLALHCADPGPYELELKLPYPVKEVTTLPLWVLLLFPEWLYTAVE